jgi:hypothetical protein
LRGRNPENKALLEVLELILDLDQRYPVMHYPLADVNGSANVEMDSPARPTRVSQ